MLRSPRFDCAIHDQGRALWRAGLLSTSQPMEPSRLAFTRSVPLSMPVVASIRSPVGSAAPRSAPPHSRDRAAPRRCARPTPARRDPCGSACAPESPAGRRDRSRQADLCFTGRAIARCRNLRVVKDLIDTINRSTGHAGAIQALNPFSGPRRRFNFADMASTTAVPLRVRVLVHRQSADLPAGPSPSTTSQKRCHMGCGSAQDIDGIVGSGKKARGDRRRVIVACLGPPPLPPSASALPGKSSRGDLGLQEGTVHPLTAARALALDEGEQHAHGGEQAGRQIVDGDPCPDGALAR